MSLWRRYRLWVERKPQGSASKTRHDAFTHWLAECGFLVCEEGGFYRDGHLSAMWAAVPPHGRWLRYRGGR